MTTAYVGLGANLGDPIEQIVFARQQLSKHAQISDLKSSSLYVSSPVGYADQADFINCVVRIETTLSPVELLNYFKSIESEMGRIRNSANRNAARKIDLDLLLYEEYQISNDEITVPHPRMHQRLFVLEPLKELDPTVLIGSKGSVVETIEQGIEQSLFEDQQLYKLG